MRAILIWALIVSASCSSSDDEALPSSFVTAGYMPDYRFYIGHLNYTALRLTDLILFSMEVPALQLMQQHHQLTPSHRPAALRVPPSGLHDPDLDPEWLSEVPRLLIAPVVQGPVAALEDGVG